MARPLRKLLFLAFLSASTVAALAVTHPRLTGPVTKWSGDDVALATAWLLAMVLSAWLAVVCGAGVVALARRDRRAAIRIARFGPAFVRRVVEAAVVVMCTVGPATAANAATVHPRPPVVVHVNADGTMEVERSGVRPVEPGRATNVADEPVVRAPIPAPTTPTTAARPSSTPRTPASPVPRSVARPPATAHVSRPRRADVTTHADAAPVSVAGTTRHVVQHGESLWTIARQTVATADHRAVGSDQIAPYWRRVVAANRNTLRSGNPSLIFAGEIVALPPIPAA